MPSKKRNKSASTFKSKYRAREVDPEKPFDRKASRVKAIESFEDAFDSDGEDDFHRQRDEVLLEDDGTRGYDDDEIEDEEEVYGLDLPSADSGSESASEAEVPDAASNKTREFKRKPVDTEPKGRFAAAATRPTVEGEPHSEHESEDDDDESEDDKWDPHAYHATRRAPGEADSEDEEAAELEANEALRIQKKSRATLSAADFGLDDEEDDEADSARPAEDLLLQGPKTEEQTMSSEEAIAWLVKNQPETLALLDDFRDAVPRAETVERNLAVVRAESAKQGREHPALAILELEHQALATYVPVLAFYFSLLVSPGRVDQSLLDRVLARLSSLRTALATMEELDLTSTGPAGSDEDNGDDDESGSENGEDEEGMFASDVLDRGGMEAIMNGSASDSDESDDESEFDSEGSDEEGDEIDESILAGLTDEDIDRLMKESDPEGGADAFIAKVQELQASRGLLANGHDDVAISDEDDYEEMQTIGAPQPPKKQKQKPQRAIPTLAPLDKKAFKKNAAASQKRTRTIEDDLIDATSLSKTDELDKSSARHSLRFHVSQVNQKAAKRESGHGRRVGGDDDLPVRSKERSRREVLKRQRHGEDGEADTRLDEVDWDEEDRRIAKRVRADTDADADQGGREDDDYYDLVKTNKEEKREAKKAKYDADRMEAKAELDRASEENAAGPRGVSRQILANRGLTPRRKKENRNARVKKRVQYAKAQKKVASQKRVFKGGIAALPGGQYTGEKTGIGRKTVKSVKL